MAATDQTFRNQKGLDIVFAVSCLLMLVSVVWMFAQDYYRPWKVEQRDFRDVEEALAQREMLRLAPTSEQMQAIEEAERAVSEAWKAAQQKRDEVSKLAGEWITKKTRSENKYQAIKADFDSKMSLYNIAVQQHGPDSDEAKAQRAAVDQLQQELNAAQGEVDDNTGQLREVAKPQTEAEEALTKAEEKLKKLTGDFDRFHKLAEQKRWKTGDWFRALPVIDAFASPTRIQQFVLEEYPINYNFKYVTRYDRCTTCHLGIERPAFDKRALAELADAPSEKIKERLNTARTLLRKKKEILSGTPNATSGDPDDLQLLQVKLSEARVNEYCAHPRLDLFVDANSPHPAEKFGCTSCHAGQGSATDFFNASHSPNDPVAKKRWEEEHGWESNHFWDFGMQPKRFVESSCVKCHHQITDLIREGSKIEAPKLVRGYNLVRENGCFGCHEISGNRSIQNVSNRVGPDLRLEPSPPPENLTPAERAKLYSDPTNPPGTLRKVGPSLRRITEKTNEGWTVRWIRSPRDFRPDTKMPHFYGLSNNLPEVFANAPDEETRKQKDFPDAEIHSVAHYLFRRSESFLKGAATHRQDPASKAQSEREQYDLLKSKTNPTEAEKAEMDEILRRMQMRAAPELILEKELPPPPKDPKAYAADGRRLFSERGCLACHSHSAMEQPGGKTANGLSLPAIKSDAHFGPNLSQIAAKLGDQPGDAKARRWLVQWIMNPTVYHPRTFMPITHLTLEQADQIAAWLLSQRSDPGPGADVARTLEHKTELETLKNIARLYLRKAGMTKRQVDAVLADGFSEDVLEHLGKEADERELSAPLDDNKLQMYIGRKAIGQLGCYGCHDIPGFEQAKPIGTPLNEWGKKDPERLAFEDIMAYVDKHDHRVSLRDDPKDKTKPAADWKVEDGKMPYEGFFYDALAHHTREGFLHQKLMEPRSYDYDRIRAWDDRLRMPQFRFSRTSLRDDATPEEKALAEREEADAREAVMTFILGLIGDPTPAKYLYEPLPDRRAEVRGRQVLDKFNCAGCHLVRSGVFELKESPQAIQQLDRSYETASASFASDHRFLDSNAWVGATSPRAGLLTAFGDRPQLMPDPDDDSGQRQLLVVRLTQALRYTTKVGDKEETRDIPASSSLRLLNEPDAVTYSSDPFGGRFANQLVKYLGQRDPDKYKPDAEGDSTDGRAQSPPSLIREGEKVQPEWLFRFLKNPIEIRPVAVLRMPKFNMSDEEAMALVNYFASVDKVNNPAAGINYPYVPIPQRDEEYFRKLSVEYVERLKKTKVPPDLVDVYKKQKLFAEGDTLYNIRVKELRPIWEEAYKAQLKDLEEKSKTAQARIATAKPEELAGVKEAAQALERQIATLKKKGTAALQSDWEEKEAYIGDGYRLVANDNICLACHQISNLEPKQRQGPSLNLAWERLRPEWTGRWIASPQRFLTYTTPMPQNFPRDTPRWTEYFVGSSPEKASLEQALAARDILMILPRAAEMPINRQRPVAGGGGQ